MAYIEYAITFCVLLAALTALAFTTPYAARNPARTGTVVIGIIAVLAITPLCGLMFNCGCDWPWHKLHLNCNYFLLEAKRKCPWCGNAIAGGISTISAIGLAGFTTYRFSVRPILIDDDATLRWHLARAVTAGGAAFHVVALVGGVAAALLAGHPLPFMA